MRTLLLAALIAAFSAGSAFACGFGKTASTKTTDEQVASAPASSSQPVKSEQSGK
jgi:hypothetical protein